MFVAVEVAVNRTMLVAVVCLIVRTNLARRRVL